MYDALGLVGEAYGEDETAKVAKGESTKAPLTTTPTEHTRPPTVPETLCPRPLFAWPSNPE